jgi:competence protein ComEA
MRRSGGITLLVVVLLSILLFRASRVTSLLREEFPAFHVNKPEYVTLYLGQGFRIQGYHQFIDGVSADDVIQMAEFELNAEVVKSFADKGPLRSGEGLELVFMNAEVVDVARFFVPAGQCMALGIPLHPDTMKASDWQALPGIGPRLAERIMADRQKNGEFGDLETLKRVKGIGPGTIKRLNDFF